MQTAPATYDQRVIQDLMNKVEALEKSRFEPRDKITLRASNDATHKNLKDITVNMANTIVAVDAT
jgi:pentose-5-phosphate-3-epimerase